IVWADERDNGVAVIEGIVRASNSASEVLVQASESLSTSTEAAGLSTARGIPPERVEWSLHYPAVLTQDVLDTIPQARHDATTLAAAARYLERGQVARAEQMLADMASDIAEFRALKQALL